MRKSKSMILAAAAAAALAGGGVAVATTANPATPPRVSAAVTGSTLAAQLAFNREEERLARDLYELFADRYGGARPFSMIVKSEQQHFTAIGTLLTRYDIADPSAKAKPGVYANPALQKLYDTWKVAGLTSLDAAYDVGVALEKRDIDDLTSAIAAVPQTDVTAVLKRLRAASENHLKAFSAAADGSTGAMSPGNRHSDLERGAGRGQRQGNGQGQGRGKGLHHLTGDDLNQQQRRAQLAQG